MRIESVLAWVGGAGITVATLVTASYALFQWFGQKWLENKFAERFEEFKHQKQRELETLRTELSSRLTRANNLNQREFEVLPTLFSRMNEAYGGVADFTSPLQSVPDVDRLRADELEEILGQNEFKEFEKDQVRNANSKFDVYRSIVFWKNLNSAYKPYSNFSNYLIVNSIFLDENLRERFEKIRDVLFCFEGSRV